MDKKQKPEPKLIDDIKGPLVERPGQQERPVEKDVKDAEEDLGEDH